MLSHMAFHLSFTARPGAELGLGPGTDEGLASLPSCHKQAGPRANPSCSACCSITDNFKKTTLCFKSAANHDRLEVVQNKNFIS